MNRDSKSEKEIEEFFGDDYYHHPKFSNRKNRSEGVFSYSYYLTGVIYNMNEESEFFSDMYVNTLYDCHFDFNNYINIDGVKYIINYKYQIINNIESYLLTVNIMCEKHINVFKDIISKFYTKVSNRNNICVETNDFYVNLLREIYVDAEIIEYKENKITYFKINYE